MPVFMTPYLKEQINALAREFYQLHGYVCEEGFDFENSKHPQELRMWAMAEASYDYWRDIITEEIDLSDFDLIGIRDKYTGEVCYHMVPPGSERKEKVRYNATFDFRSFDGNIFDHLTS